MTTVIIGLPNAGKTTYSRQFDSVLHYDDIMHLPREERFALYQQAEIIEGIFNTKRSRKIILDAWEGREHKVCVWLNTPPEVCIQRSGKAEAIVKYHMKIFEPPTLDEGWDEIVEAL